MRHAWMLGVSCLAVAAGCTQRPPPFITNDRALRKPSTELAADSVKRFPYKTDAEKGGEAVARAQVGNTANWMEIVNLSDQDWSDVEIWINKNWVVYLPTMERGKLKRIPFSAIFNDKGNTFPTSIKTERLELVEVLRDGKMYTVRLQLAD